MTVDKNIIDFAKRCERGNTVPIKQVELARALLIAVEALEEMEQQQKNGSGEGIARYWNCNACGGNKPLEGVLSRIRSL